MINDRNKAGDDSDDVIYKASIPIEDGSDNTINIISIFKREGTQKKHKIDKVSIFIKNTRHSNAGERKRKKKQAQNKDGTFRL